MKIAVMIELNVSRTIAETMRRSGFTLAPDGTAMQVKVPNCPAIPRRKTKVSFIEKPSDVPPPPDVSNDPKS